MMKRKSALIALVYSCYLIALAGGTYSLARPYVHFAISKLRGVGGLIPRQSWAFDPVLGWKVQPNSSAVSWRSGERIEYLADERGRRKMDNAGSDSRCRIAVVGDSNTFGYGISVENHWMTRLRRIHPALEFVNLGVFGYGVDQELLWFRENARDLNARLVIVFVKHFEEERHLQSVLMGNPKPYFTLDSKDELVLHTDHIVDERPAPEGSFTLSDPRNPGLVMSFGIRLIQEMEKEAEKIGAEFLLLAGWSELCERAAPMPCFNVGPQLRGMGIVAPDGVRFWHINPEGSRILARDLAGHLREKNLLPDFCYERKHP